MFTKLHWVILLLIFSTVSTAQDHFIIQNDHDSFKLTQGLYVFEDPTSQLTFEQILSPAFNQKFIKLTQDSSSIGFSNATIWLKFIIKNNTQHSNWLVQSNYNAIQYFDLYQLENNQSFSHFSSGSLTALAQRPYQSYRLTFPLNIPPQSERVYYAKVKSFTPIFIDLSLKSESALLQSESAQNFVSGTIMGIMLVLLFVNLLLYLILKFQSQLFLMAYIFSMLIVYSACDGYLLLLLPNEFSHYATMIFLSFGSIAYICLYYYFELLLLREISTKVKNSLRYAIIIYWAITNILAYTTGMLLPYIMYITGAIMLPFAGAIYSGLAWFSKQYQARFICIGLSSLAIAYLIQIGQLLLILDEITPIPIEINRLGNMILITLLSIAVADYVQKFKILQKQTQTQIKQAEDKFERIFEQAYQMLFLVSSDGIVLSANNEAARFLDRDKSALLALNFIDIFTSLRGVFDQDIIKKNLNKALKGQLIKQNIVAYSKNGTLKDLEISFQPYVKNEHEINNVLVQVRDVTKQVQAFKAIQNMVIGIAGLSTENFFKKFLIEISQIYNAKYVMLSQINNTSPQTATTVAIIKDKQPIENFTYTIEHTPSEQLVAGKLCNFPSGAQQLFAKDEWLVQHQIESYLAVNIKDSDHNIIGFLSVMNDKPLDEDNYFIEVLDVFAARIGNELRQQESQEALKKALEKLDFHITHTPLGVIEWDENFNVLKWNKAAEKIFGYTLHDFINTNPLTVLLPKEEVANVLQVAKDLKANKGGRYSLNKNLTQDGKEILCEWYNTPLLDNEGQVIGVASLVNDVTAEHQALNALYIKEQEQREIFNTLMDAIFIIDHQGKILSTNNAVNKLFNYDIDELVGKSATELLTAKYAKHYDRYIAALFKCLAGQTSPVTKEIFARKKNTEEFPISLSLTIMPEDNLGQPRLLATCHDLTEFKIQQESLRQSQKMDALGNLTGGIAHDFNNLLGIINGYAELLNNNIDNTSKLHTYTQHILKASSRGAKLTKKLLSFARKNSVDKEPIDINHILLDEFDMLQKTITPRINLTYVLDDHLPLTNINKAELEDCMLNLTINAMHAIPQHGEITISTTTINLTKQQASLREVPSGKYIQLVVSDNGIGMDEKTQQKALEPFFTTKGQTGTGLGLSQVYGFVERSNGFIEIDSVVGQGTSITINLPIAFKQSIEKTLPQEAPIENIANAKILVVDDEPSLIELSSTILANAGYQVFSADSSKRALEILNKQQIDAMLCDVIMPNMGGVELAKIVQQQYPDTAVLFVSGYYEQNDNELPAEKVLKKPYDANVLLRRVAKCLTEQQQMSMT